MDMSDTRPTRPTKMVKTTKTAVTGTKQTLVTMTGLIHTFTGETCDVCGCFHREAVYPGSPCKGDECSTCGKTMCSFSKYYDCLHCHEIPPEASTLTDDDGDVPKQISIVSFRVEASGPFHYLLTRHSCIVCGSKHYGGVSPDCKKELQKCEGCGSQMCSLINYTGCKTCKAVAEAKAVEAAKATVVHEMTSDEWMETAKARALAYLPRSPMGASMSMLQDIKSSHGKPWELYPPGHIMEMMCLMTAMWDAEFIEGIN